MNTHAAECRRLLKPGILLLVSLARITAGGGYVKLAETGDQEPGGTNVYFQINPMPTLDDAGHVAFYTDLRDAGFLKGWGIFLADGSGVKTVARTGEPAPDSNGNFSTFYSLASLNSTSVVFQADLSGSLGGGSDSSGIYQWSEGHLTQWVRAGQPIPDGDGTFGSLKTVSPRTNRRGQVAFRNNTSHGFAIFLARGGTLRRVAYGLQPSPDGDGFLSVSSDPSLNDAGQVAFLGLRSGRSDASVFGIYGGDETGLKVLAYSQQPTPDGHGQFLVFPSADLPFNNLGQVAFDAILTGTPNGAADNEGLYRTDGSSLSELVRKGQTAPDGNGRFLAFSAPYRPAMNNGGLVAFAADLTGTQGGSTDNAGIFLADGNSIRQVVRKGQLVPDGNGRFFSLGSPALNDTGEVVFLATLSDTRDGTTDNQGIFIADAALMLRQVVRSGETVNGEVIAIPNLLAGPNLGGLSGLNERGQVAFSAALNGNIGVFLWSPLTITSIVRSGNDIQVAWTAQGGTTNILEAADKAAGTYSRVGAVFVPQSISGTTNLSELGGASHPARFYRVERLP